MKDKLLIIGASGHGKVVADIALKMNEWRKIVFLDDDGTLDKSIGLDVIGKSIEIDMYINEYDIFVGIGDNQIRKKIVENLVKKGAHIPILIHPNAVIGKEVIIESGTVIMAGVVINCCTRIGKGCIINTSSTIDHDNRIGDFVHISPGVNLAGAVKIGKESWIGINSTVINNVSVTNSCKVGAGAVVINDLMKTGVYTGVPAKEQITNL